MLGLRKKESLVERTVLIQIFPDVTEDCEYDVDDEIKVMIGKRGWGWLVFPKENGRTSERPGAGTAETKEAAFLEAQAWAKEWLAS